LKGKVVAVCRSAEKGQPKVDVRSGFFQKGLGMMGDAHSGTAKEISLLLKEHVDRLSQKAGLIFPPGAFAENLLIEGGDQAQMIPGRFLKIGDALLEIQKIGKEAGEKHSYHFKGHSLLPRFGIFGKVIESGVIKNGDEVELLTESP
jgi:MOSC domain-containing protein YiiM